MRENLTKNNHANCEILTFSLTQKHYIRKFDMVFLQKEKDPAQYRVFLA